MDAFYFRAMRFPLCTVLLLALLAACRSGKDKDSLCTRFFQPYPDMVSNRPATPRNNALIAAMVLYNKGSYAEAAKALRPLVDEDGSDLATRMYLLNALLASGEPYKAEVQLDYLETTHDQSFRDQVDWYNALCWLCEGQQAKALQQARYIVDRPHHTYHEAAAALAATLSGP